nr:G protein-coupled receptor [Proales similis]
MNASSNFSLLFNASNSSVRQPQQANMDVPGYTIIAAVIVYSLIFLVGFFGNTLVILVAFFNQRKQHNTHYCLVNLSIADLLLIIVCMPSAIIDLFAKEVWYLGGFFCKVIPWLENTIAHASILTIVSISVERSLAIAAPLKAKSIFTRTRLFMSVVLIWVLSGLSSAPTIPITIFSNAYHRALEKEVHICFIYTKGTWQLAYLFLSLFFFYLLPCVLLFLLYGKVMLVIRNRNKHNDLGVCVVNSSSERRKSSRPSEAGGKSEEHTGPACKSEFKSRCESSQSEATASNMAGLKRIKNTQKHTIILLIIMMFLVLLSLLPYRVFSLWAAMATKEQLTDLGITGYYNLLIFSRVAFYINSALNPIFYHIISTKFQDSFKRFIRQHNASSRKRLLGTSHH